MPSPSHHPSLSPVPVPTVGRIVHYYCLVNSNESELHVRAAVVTDATPPSEVVGLCVFHLRGMEFRTDVPFSSEPRAGYWTWPPRVAS